MNQIEPKIEVRKEFVKYMFSKEDFQDLYVQWMARPNMPRVDVYNSYYREYLCDNSVACDHPEFGFLEPLTEENERLHYIWENKSNPVRSPHGYIGLRPIPASDLWDDLTNFLYQDLIKMPLYINKKLWKGIVSRWRLSLGK